MRSEWTGTPAVRREPRYIRPKECALLAAALLLTIAWPLDAINIVIQLDDDGQNPNYDPAGTRLEAVFRAAEAIWERLLPDSGTYEIDVWWGDLDDGVGGEWQHTGTTADNNIVIDPTPRLANGTNLGWFIDDTSSDHSEFDFLTKTPNTGQGGNAAGMTVYRDLDASQQGAWFDVAAPPGVLEVGYIGAPVTLLPAASDVTVIVQPSRTVDLLSVVLHEIGHELGVNSLDIEDGWEIDPVHINGIQDVNMDDTDADNGAHLQILMALMSTSTGSNQRVLPAAADVLAVAWDESFTNVDLERKHMLNGGNWNTAANWVGNRLPDQSDDAYLVHGHAVTLTGNARVRNLMISDDSTLFTGSQDLRVDQVTRIDASSTLGIGGTARLNSVVIQGSGLLIMQNGTLRVGDLDNDNTLSTGISGRGTIQIDNTLVNNSQISASSSVLTILGPGTLDLDGDSSDGVPDDGRLLLLLGDLHSEAVLTDDFDGVMTIGSGRTATMRFFGLGPGGMLRMWGAPGAPATLAGVGAVTTHGLRGQVQVNTSGIIASDIAAFHDTAAVTMLDLGDTLRLESGLSLFDGASFTGDGKLVQNFDIRVESDTQIDVARYDWGSNTTGVVSRTTVQEDVTFTINALTSGDGH